VRERERRKERERRETKQGGGKKEREQLTTASVSTRMSPKCALVTMICNS
jgi:hypothetical protein